MVTLGYQLDDISRNQARLVGSASPKCVDSVSAGEQIDEVGRPGGHLPRNLVKFVSAGEHPAATESPGIRPAPSYRPQSPEGMASSISRFVPGSEAASQYVTRVVEP
jgi:hypothetical protein